MTLCWVARAVTHLPSSDGIYLILYMSYFSKTTPLPDSPSHLTVASQDEAGGEVLKVDHHCCVASAATQGDATGATGAKAWCAVWGSPKWRVFIMGNTSVNGWFGGSHSLGNPIVEDDLYIFFTLKSDEIGHCMGFSCELSGGSMIEDIERILNICVLASLWKTWICWTCDWLFYRFIHVNSLFVGSIMISQLLLIICSFLWSSSAIPRKQIYIVINSPYPMASNGSMLYHAILHDVYTYIRSYLYCNNKICHIVL